MFLGMALCQPINDCNANSPSAKFLGDKGSQIHATRNEIVVLMNEKLLKRKRMCRGAMVQESILSGKAMQLSQQNLKTILKSKGKQSYKIREVFTIRCYIQMVKSNVNVIYN